MKLLSIKQSLRVITFLLLIASVSIASSSSENIYLTEKLINQSDAYMNYSLMYKSEAAKIDYLISLIRESEFMFIRNRSRYTSEQAAKFLSLKWEHFNSKAHTAKEFIDNIASFSSTTGKLYYLALSKKSKVPLGKVLGDELDRLEDYERDQDESLDS